MTQYDSPSTFLPGNDYLNLPREPQPWVIRQLIPLNGLVNMYGRPKAGKSFGAIGLANAIADPAVEEWLGFEVVRHGRVLYLQIDTPRSIWADRLEKVRAAGYGLDNIYFADSLMAPYPFNILNPDCEKWLKERVKKLDPLVVIIDTLRESHDVDENSSGEMKKVINALWLACDRSALIFISHSKKGGVEHEKYELDLMDENRGSGYVAGRMDLVMKVTEKKLVLKGRSVEEMTVPIVRVPCGLLAQDDKKVEQDEVGKEVYGDPRYKTMTAKSKALAERVHITEVAARQRLYRIREKEKQKSPIEEAQQGKPVVIGDVL